MPAPANDIEPSLEERQRCAQPVMKRPPILY